MHTVEITKLKGDLLLELKDIRDSINIEKAKLEILERERIAYGSSYNFKQLEEKFASVAGDAELHLEIIKSKIIEEEKIFSKVKFQNQQIISNNKKLEEDAESKIKQLTQEINDKKMFKEDITKQIKIASDILNSHTIKSSKISNENKIIEEKNKQTELGLAQRENLVSEREKKIENTKSDLRIWSVRLHNRYGHLMSDVEKQLVKY